MPLPASTPAPAAAATLQRRGPGLRLKLLVGLIAMIGVLFAGLNYYNMNNNRQKRRAEALSATDTVARLMVGALLGELVSNDIQSTRIKTFLGNFLNSTFALNSKNQELAFVLVVDAHDKVVQGRARTELTVFPGNVTYAEQSEVLQKIAESEGKLAHIMQVKRFPLMVSGQGLVGKLLVGTSMVRLQHEAQQELIYNTLAFIVALVLLFIYATATLGVWVLRPLTQVVAAMQRIQQGDLSAEVQIAARDEMGTLADTYTFMVRGLRERERLKDAFNRYVSKQVYEKFQAGEVSLIGENRQATVLFSDIRSFTTLSEQLTPPEVVAMLNEYFNVMVEIVFRYDGFVNKFIGDALMAIYNVPVDQPHPELRAVKTAVEMMQSLEVLNADRQTRGLFPIKIGIGVNTGPVVAGNIGHQQRLEYTVIGDAVNLAQRIESQTKVAGATVLISESTYAAVAEYVDATALEPVKVKGKAESVALYSIAGFKSEETVSAVLGIAPYQPALGLSSKETAHGAHQA